MLLHLVPLIQTAWAEGGVTQKERDLIVRAARSRGIERGSSADQQLIRWLTERPSEELFEKTLRAIRAILQAARPKSVRPASAICSHSARPSRRRLAASSDSARCRKRSARSWRTSARNWKRAESRNGASRPGLDGGVCRDLRDPDSVISFAGALSADCFRRLSLCSLPSSSLT